jgi:hypothetical protein
MAWRSRFAQADTRGPRAKKAEEQAPAHTCEEERAGLAKGNVL